MHDRDLVSVLGELHHRLRAFLESLFIFERRAADLDDNFHCRPSASSQPYIRFMFCTA